MTLQQSATPVREVALVFVAASCVCVCFHLGLHLRTCFEFFLCESEFEGLRQHPDIDLVVFAGKSTKV